MNKIEELAQLLHEKIINSLKKQNDGELFKNIVNGRHDIPITVDGVDCVLYFSFDTHSNACDEMSFRLCDPFIKVKLNDDDDDDDDDCEQCPYSYYMHMFIKKDGFFVWSEITVDTILTFLQKTREKLDTLVFCKQKGVFLTQTDFKIKQAMHGTFEKFIKKNDVCSVCLEKTMTKTQCKHTLCFACWQKIETLTCPMCRRGIHVYKCVDWN